MKQQKSMVLTKYAILTLPVFYQWVGYSQLMLRKMQGNAQIVIHKKKMTDLPIRSFKNSGKEMSDFDHIKVLQMFHFPHL